MSMKITELEYELKASYKSYKISVEYSCDYCEYTSKTIDLFKEHITLNLMQVTASTPKKKENPIASTLLNSMCFLKWGWKMILLIPLHPQSSSRRSVPPTSAQTWPTIISPSEIFSWKTTIISSFVTPTPDSFPWSKSGRTPILKSDKVTNRRRNLKTNWA